MPEFMPDFVNIDHRRARGFAPGDLTAYMRATWDLAPDVIAYAEAVHQLSNLGAVFTQAVSGTSQDGFEAEWREIVLATIDGNLINRIELFEEADIDAALAHFDELSTPAPRLENAASQVTERFWTCFEARDWAAMAEIMADDISSDDRRRVVGAGVRHGRDAQIADMRAVADLGITNVTSTVMATRGERLILTRARYSGRDQGPDAYLTEVLGVYESTPTTVSRRSSRSTLTTSTPPSRSSTRGTSPAKPPPTRAHGRSSRRPSLQSPGTSSPR